LKWTSVDYSIDLDMLCADYYVKCMCLVEIGSAIASRREMSDAVQIELKVERLYKCTEEQEMEKHTKQER